MRGNYEANQEFYPFLVQHVGTNEIGVLNALEGTTVHREELAGTYASDARNAQLHRLEAQALRLCNERRTRASACAGVQVAQAV